jgi:predicted RNA-binding Zn-ribbon protein involved in translation (DUF1610 family)
VFVKYDSGPHKNLRGYVLRNKCIPYICNECGLLPEWEGEPLSIHLHHVNGDNLDDRLGNLQFLCPNCHAQTPTFTGKNLKLKRSKMP